jgi:hypothetical protein
VYPWIVVRNFSGRYKSQKRLHVGDYRVGLLFLRNMARELDLLQARIWYRCIQPLTYQ